MEPAGDLLPRHDDERAAEQRQDHGRADADRGPAAPQVVGGEEEAGRHRQGTDPAARRDGSIGRHRREGQRGPDQEGEHQLGRGGDRGQRLDRDQADEAQARDRVQPPVRAGLVRGRVRDPGRQLAAAAYQVVRTGLVKREPGCLPADKIWHLRTVSPVRGGEVEPVSPGPRQPSAATPSSIEGLVRRATPYSIAGLVALYGLAAAGLSLAGLSGQSAALALLVGLIVLFAVVVAGVNRDARSVAATVERESRTVRDSLAWVRMALDHADVGMGIIDSRGSWLHVNSRLGAMLGRSEADLLATSLPAITADALSGAITESLAQAASSPNGGWKAETLQVRADGGAFPVSLSVTPLGDGSARAVTFLVQEAGISAAKRAETVRDVMVAVRHAISTSATWEQAAPAVLSAMGSQLGWDVAQLWSTDADAKVLRLRQSWQADDPRLSEFDRAAHSLALPANSGVMGRAIRSGVPAVNEEVTPASESLIGEAARRAGLTVEVASPVTIGGTVSGLLVPPMVTGLATSTVR